MSENSWVFKRNDTIFYTFGLRGSRFAIDKLSTALAWPQGMCGVNGTLAGPAEAATAFHPAHNVVGVELGPVVRSQVRQSGSRTARDAPSAFT